MRILSVVFTLLVLGLTAGAATLNPKVFQFEDGTSARNFFYRQPVSLPTIVFAYDSLDINSIRMFETVNQVADLVEGFVLVSAIDSRNPKTQYLLDSWNVQATPTIKLLPVIGQRRSQHDKSPLAKIGSGIRTPVDYQEKNLSPEAIKKWSLSYLPSTMVERITNDKPKTQLLELTNAALQEDSKVLPVALLFTDKDATSQLYRSLSIQFADRVQFLEVHKNAQGIVSHFRIEKFPTLLLVQSKKNPEKRIHGPVMYEGKLNVTDMKVFFSTFVASESKLQTLRNKQETKLIQNARSIAENPLLPVTTVEDWHKEVLERSKPTAVLFCDPESPSVRTLNEMLRSEKGQKAAKGIKFVRIGRSENHQLLKFFAGDAIDDTEDFLVFLNPKKEVFTRYVGALNAESIIHFIQGKIATGSGAKPFSISEVPTFEESKEAKP